MNKSRLIVVSAFLLQIFYFTIIHIFSVALVNGGRVTVVIDYFNEGFFEYALFMCLFPIIILGMTYLVEEYVFE